MTDAPKYAVIVTMHPDPEQKVADISTYEAPTLMNAFDAIRDTVAQDPPWMMICLIRGEDLGKVLADPRVEFEGRGKTAGG